MIEKNMWTFTNVVALSKTIAQGNLHEAFFETLRLLKIPVVSPTATAEQGGGGSKFNRPGNFEIKSAHF